MLFVIIGIVLLLFHTTAAAPPDATPPVADAGPDVTMHSTGAARLDGSASTASGRSVEVRRTMHALHDGGPVTAGWR